MSEQLHSGLYDINGKELKPGDVIRITVLHHITRKKLSSGQKTVRYQHGAFRVDDPYHEQGSVIGNFGENVEIEVVGYDDATAQRES